jgi:hypothetical protein
MSRVALTTVQQRAIRLEWVPPRRLDDLGPLDTLFPAEGVYCFLLDFDGVPTPYYVGKGHLRDRIKSHVREVSKGDWKIWTQDALRTWHQHDRKKNTAKCPQLAYIPSLYRPDRYREWLERRGEILPHLKYMLERLRVTWAVAPPGTNLLALEGTLFRHHGIEYLINWPGSTDRTYDDLVVMGGAWSMFRRIDQLQPPRESPG